MRRTAAKSETRHGVRRMAVFFLLSLTLSFLTPAVSFAQTLFGPKSYTLTTSTPQTTSTLVSTTSGPAYLSLTNGNADGSARLRDATITVNGVEIVNAQDLGSDVAIVDKPITLLSNNVLVVTLTGPQSGTLSVTLERRTASLTSVTPASGRQGETLTVTVVGSNTHFVQGTTQLFAGPGISVGGAPPGTFGPVTVTDTTHLTATLAIQPTTILGPRTLVAKTNGEKAALFQGFTVLAGTPAIAGTTVTTLAGSGTAGNTDGSATTAQFRLPFDVAPRSDGSSVVADTGNSKLRAIAPDGTVSTVTLPVTLLLPTGVTMDSAGRTIIADTGRCVIRIVNPDSTVTTIGSGTCGFADGAAGSARFKFPRDVVSDAAGNLYVADTGNFRVRKIAPDGTVSTLAGSGLFGDTNGSATTATFGLLSGIAVASDGTVVVSDAVFHKIRQIAPDGTVSTLAGTGVAGFADGAALSAQFAFPTGLTRDATGNLYIADALNNLIRRLTPAGQVETIAGTGARGSQDGPGSTATFTLPAGVGLATAAPSRVFVADTGNHKIRVVQVVPPPVITALSPTSAVQGDTFPLTITGTHLTGATAVTFLRSGTPDSAITASNLQVNADGTQLTATVTIALTAPLGTKVVTVTTAGGTSSSTASSANTFIVLGRLSLIPTFQTLTQGGSGGLTVEITTPAPAGGLAITLTSTNTAVATLPPSVLIPQGSTSVLTSVTAVGEGSSTLSASATGYATATAAVTVILPPPTITGFSPSSGQVGTAVTITGGPFSTVNPLTNTASFTGPNNTRISVPVTTLSSTQLRTTVPSGAVSGPLQVSTPYGSALSTGHFVVLPSPDFTLTATPTAVASSPGGTATYRVSAGGLDGFTGLITLSATGLPTGITAAFTPPTIAPGQSGTLTLQVGAGAATGTAPLTLTGTATISGAPRSHTTTVTLDVQAPGQTVLAGQVRDENDQPLAGVSITLGGTVITTLGTTDAGGNFFLALSVTGAQVFLIDGSTANTPTVSYSTIPVTLTIQPGVVNTLGFTPRLQAQPTAKLIPITAGQATVLTDPDIPGFQMTIPAGVQVIGWDGQPNTRVSVTAVPVDRSPLPPPPPGLTARQMYLFSFGKVGGGTPTGNIPIDTPNDVDGLPGDTVDLYYFNEAPDGTAPNRWEKYGTGTISSDGTRILTDINPATGQPYGIPRFCCGVRLNAPPGSPRPGGGPPGGPSDGGHHEGEPVDVATGFFYLEKTDLVLPGIIPLAITRTYRTNLTNATLFGLPVSDGPFGQGTSWNYDLFLLPPPGNSPDALLLYSPGNRQDLFVRQPDGSFVNTTSPALRGAVITVSGGVRSLRFKDGRLWRFTAAGLLLSQADRLGNTVTLTRDSQGRVTAITDPTGRQLRISYAGANLRIDSIQDSLNREVRYTYDSPGRLSSITDPAGGVTAYTYDSQHRMLTITDPRGITFLTNEYDAAGRILRQTQADGGVWAFAYTATGSFISSATVTDPRGQIRTPRFNAAGYLIGTTDALGQTTTLTRAPGSNLLLATTDPLGRVTRFTYDANGNVTTITDPAGNARSFTYEPVFNKVTSVTDPLGNVTTFEYDTVGNLIAITDPEQNLKPVAERLKTRITYNSFGQPITTTDPLGNTTTFEYDAVGNLTKITDPLGNRTTREYDAASRLMRQIDPRGKPTTFTYDPLNRLTQIRDPLGGVTTFTYDPNGNLLTVTDARGSTTPHTYDTMDRLLSRMDPLGRIESYQYDGMGNLVSFTDRKGQGSTFTYDALNRRVRSTFGDGAFTEFVYDAVGRLVTATDSVTGAITEEYDVLNRLLRETAPQGSIQYAYDAMGRRTTMTVNGQAPVSYTYDAASRLTQLAQAPLTPVTINYDATGRRTLLRLPNGVTTAYDYDTASRLTRLTYTSPSSLLGDLQYTYDTAGNRTAVGGSFARTLLPDSVPSATYDAANQQLTFGAKAMTYDNNGNLASLTEPPGTTSFTWDSRNRLAALSGTTTGSFAYDVQGRRVRRDLSGEAREYQYDGLDIVRERINGTDASYLRTLGVDEAVCRIAPEGTSYYLADALSSTLALTDSGGTLGTMYTYDPFGRTVAAGALNANPFQYTGRENDGAGLYYYRNRYYSPISQRFTTEDPLHSPLRKMSGSSCQDNYAPNTSWYLDVDPGLALLMMFRFYGFANSFAADPKQLHLYTYVYNNPVNKVDPEGLWSDPQTPGCDQFLDFNYCATQCCNAHDKCYERAFSKCTSRTWLEQYFPYGKYGGRTKVDCQDCNSAVVRCLARATWHWGKKGPC